MVAAPLFLRFSAPLRLAVIFCWRSAAASDAPIMIVFAWDDWNADHLLKHHVTTEEADYVVRNARPPFPREISDEKHLVWGPTQTARLLQAISPMRR